MIWTWIMNTAASPEFWKAAVGFATAGGITLDPAQANAWVASGLALSGLINAYKHTTGK